MKKIWFVVVLLVFAAFWFLGQKGMAGSFGGADSVLSANIDEVISPDKIYVFIQRGCPHCWHAEAYLKEKHPDLKIHMLDIAEEENVGLFYACGAKFKLNRNTLGTPLFCMGDKHILGWDKDAEAEFENNLKLMQKK